MNEIDRYIQDVMHNIHAPAAGRERIEGDLRAHLQEAVQAGESPKVVLTRMGSPTEVAAEFMSEIPLPYASIWLRLAAYVVDLAVIFTAAGALALVGAALFVNVPKNPVSWEWIAGGLMTVAAISCFLAALGIFLLYFPILEGRFGQTVGKRLVGLVVLKENGLSISYKDAFLRRLPFYFSFGALDALFVFFTRKRQRAFDIVARTVVVREATARYAAAVVASLAVLFVIVLLGFGFALRASQIREGWSGYNRPGEIAYTYTRFTSTERGDIQAKAGQTILLAYQATVSSGSLNLRVENPSRNVVWLVRLGASPDNYRDSVPIPAGQTGHYTILIEGQDTAGGFDVSWQKR